MRMLRPVRLATGLAAAVGVLGVLGVLRVGSGPMAGSSPGAAAAEPSTGTAAPGSSPGAAAAGPAGGSSEQNPTVVFTTPGPQTVTLTACNAAGCSSITKTVTVLDPRPAVSSFSATPARLEQGQSVLLDATASGAPPLAYSWQVLRGGVVVGTLFGAGASWPTAGAPAGTYTASVSVTNGFGTAGESADFTVVPASATRFFTVPPCRALDTRLSHQPLVGPGPPLAIAIGGVCGVPIGARAVAANVTVVGPTAGGYVAVYPADYAHATVSWVNFGAGATRANGGVLPLSTDGTARLAAAASMVGSANLLVDISGYFASPGPGTGGPPAAVEFQARLCPFGFCEFAAGTEVFFSQAFAGSPSEYRYDWTGSGVFTDRSPAPIKSHVYPSAVGVVAPAVQVVAGSAVSTLAQAAPMVILAGTPAALPAAPAGVSATFAGYVSSSPVDPTIAGLHPAYQLAIANPPPNLYGYDVYASKNGGPFQLVAALEPGLPASEPLVVDNFTPPGDSLRIAVAAVSFAGEGPRSAPLALTHP